MAETRNNSVFYLCYLNKSKHNVDVEVRLEFRQRSYQCSYIVGIRKIIDDT